MKHASRMGARTGQKNIGFAPKSTQHDVKNHEKCIQNDTLEAIQKQTVFL